MKLCNWDTFLLLDTREQLENKKYIRCILYEIYSKHDSLRDVKFQISRATVSVIPYFLKLQATQLYISGPSPPSMLSLFYVYMPQHFLSSCYSSDGRYFLCSCRKIGCNITPWNTAGNAPYCLSFTLCTGFPWSSCLQYCDIKHNILVI